MQCSHPGCDATYITPGGLTNIAAYSNSDGERWLCEAHLPDDFRRIRAHATRMTPQEMLAMHAHVGKNMEALTSAARTTPPKASD